MTNQVVYHTNADYEASYENMRKSNVVVVNQTQKYLIRGKVKESKTVFLLSPEGKLQVFWKSLQQKLMDFKIIKSYLVPKEGQKLIVEPLFQHLKNRIAYPELNFFIKLYWCNKAYHYHKLIVNPYLSKKERELMKLELEAYELWLKIFYEFKEDSGSLFGSPIILIHKD